MYYYGICRFINYEDKTIEYTTKLFKYKKLAEDKLIEYINQLPEGTNIIQYEVLTLDKGE